jgi:hypothetical protein
MIVRSHAKSQNAAELPVFKVTLECSDPKMKLSIKSESSALYQEYPLGHTVTVRIEAYAQKKIDEIMKGAEE